MAGHGQQCRCIGDVGCDLTGAMEESHSCVGHPCGEEESSVGRHVVDCVGMGIS